MRAREAHYSDARAGAGPGEGVAAHTGILWAMGGKGEDGPPGRSPRNGMRRVF